MNKRRFALLCPTALLACMALSAQAEVVNQFEVTMTDQLQLHSRTQIDNWYVSGYNRLSNEPSASLHQLEGSDQTWYFNGGYQRPIYQELDLFVEAGVNSEYQDLATQRGFNVATGVKFQASDNLSVASKLTSVHKDNQAGLEHSLELSGSYQLRNRFNLEASYQIETIRDTDEQQLQQQLRVGLGYRF